MFAQDHRAPRVPQPTSFDDVKPSFLEWSEEVIAYLAVTDYHEFIPLLSAAAAASKDVIEKRCHVQRDLVRDSREYRQGHSSTGSKGAG